MKVDGSYFITIKELLEKIQNENHEVFMFGTSKFAKIVSDELNYYNIKIVSYLDNDANKWGKSFNNAEILNPQEILKYCNPVVVIGSSYVYEMINQLKELGISSAFVLCDTFQYPYHELAYENKLLEKYSNEHGTKNSGNVLIKAFDGLGDNILKLGVYNFLGNIKDGKSFFHIIVHKRSNYELLSLFFKNVTLIDKDKFLNDSKYRISILENIDMNYYDYDINFLQIYYYELINENNTNIMISYRNRILTHEDYFLNSQINLIKNIYNVPNDYDFSPKGLIDDKIDNVKMPINISGKYVCIGVGYDSGCKYYSPGNWAKVVNSLLKTQYKIIFLGYGKSDEEIIDEILDNLEGRYEKKIINLCSKLSILETLKVIQSSDLYVGNDSGLAHCAYVLNKKSIVLMGGAEYHKYMHDDKKITYISNKLDCYYCGARCIYKKNTEEFSKCISGIKSESIIKAIYDAIE